MFPCFLHHHWSILYTHNFLVRECFYLLVSLVFSSDVFISGHKLILIFEGREGGLKLKPCECNDIANATFQINHYESIVPQICRIIDVCPKKSTWNPISLSAKQGLPYVFTVEAKDSYGNTYEYDDAQLKVLLISKYSFAMESSVVLEDRLKWKKGTYSISLTPKASGPHYLSITINGQDVQQCPHDLHIEETTFF